MNATATYTNPKYAVGRKHLPLDDSGAEYSPAVEAELERVFGVCDTCAGTESVTNICTCDAIEPHVDNEGHEVYS
jgi:hypothetical protein